MATEKQVRMLLARAKAANYLLSKETAEDLSNGGVDDMLADIADFTQEGQRKKEVKQPQPSNNFNEMRFGMCAKKVIESNNISWCIAERGKFASEVLSLYESVSNAASMVKLEVDKWNGSSQ